MENVKSKRSRAVSILLIFSMIASFVFGYMPATPVLADDLNSFTLKWDNDQETLNVNTNGDANKVSVTGKAYFHGSGTYPAGEIKITAPKTLAWGRDGEVATIPDNYNQHPS